MRPKRLLGTVVAATILLSATACGSTPTKTPPPTPQAANTSHTAPQAPVVGACRNLSFAAAASTSDDTTPVPCASHHTAVTVTVGSLVDKKHPTFTDVNSPAIQQRLAVACPRAVKAYAGGSAETFKLSLVQALWFLPTPTQIADGARWYRCDMVVLAGPNQLATLTGRMRNMLAPPHALNRWGTCGQVAPSSPKFRHELCSAKHKWRAIAIVTLPQKSRYLAKAATASATKSCGTIAASNAAGALKYTWSFEWPNKQQWQAGQRYGLCWLPRSN